MLKTVLTNSTARRSWQVLALCATGLLAACSNSSNSDDPISITVTPSTIEAGESALLSWSTGGAATSCTATGAWSGSQPTSSGDAGVSTGVITEPGTYTYTLNCTGSFGTSTGSTVLTVTPAAVPLALDCGIGVAPTQALRSADGATVAVNNGSAIFCVGCTVDNPDNIVDKTLPEDITGLFATVNTPLVINGATTVTVSGAPVSGSYPVGPAGFLISAGAPDTPLATPARNDLVVQTLLDGEVVESFATTQTSYFGFTTQPNDINLQDGTPFTIQFLGLNYSTVPSETVIFLGVNATLPYDAIRLASGSQINGGASLNVYAACASAP